MTHVRLLVSDRLGVPDGLVLMVGGTEISRGHANDAYGGYTTITMDMPDAPANAHTMVPRLARREHGRVALTAIEYFDADGRHIQTRR